MSAARPALTLPEMMLAVVLLAVMSTVAVVSLAGARRAASARDVVDQVAAYDRLTREWCRRFGRPAAVVFDLDRGTMARLASGESAAALRLPSGFRLARVVSRQGSNDVGQARIGFSADGGAPTYAVMLSEPRGDQWLLMTGLTGQAVRLRDAQEAQDIFAALGSRDDAR